MEANILKLKQLRTTVKLSAVTRGSETERKSVQPTQSRLAKSHIETKTPVKESTAYLVGGNHQP